MGLASTAVPRPAEAVKVTLDLDKLLRQKRISPEEYARLKSLAAADTGSLALNIFLGFGVIATAVGALAFVHSAHTSSRTSLFLVNFGFWVGSLWGDSPGSSSGESFGHGESIPAGMFAIAWAAALLMTGMWAARENRRRVVNLVAVFGAIHFYTQYFERLGASPGTIVLAGLAAIGLALALVRYNRSEGDLPPSTMARA